MVRYLHTYIILAATCFNVTAQSAAWDQSSECLQYLHIAHTRTSANPLMDQVSEDLDYSIYDMLWLGGDLALATSADDLTMQHVDSIFDLGAETTLWALGNHDYADLERVQDFTARPTYYAYYRNNMTFLVLDTQDSLSNITGQQKELFFKVADTIAESSHLILLHHKLIWMYDDPYLHSQMSYIPNGGYGDCFYCINPNNFYSEIYPELLEIEAKGVEVICIAGDIGFRRNEFEYLTPEGIQYLASGIEAGDPYNQALLLNHEPGSSELSWEFVLLSDLQSRDGLPPTLHSVFISPDSISRGQTISISLEVEDLDSGLDSIYADIINPFGEQLHSISNHIDDWKSWGDHRYSYDLSVADTFELGTWQLSALSVTDSAGNKLCLSNTDSVLATFTVFLPLGKEEIPSFQSTLFPNPGSGVFHFSGKERIKSVEVFDQLGRMVQKSNDLKANTLDLSGEPEGIYYIRLHNSHHQIHFMKVIISRGFGP